MCCLFADAPRFLLRGFLLCECATVCLSVMAIWVIPRFCVFIKKADVNISGRAFWGICPVILLGKT